MMKQRLIQLLLLVATLSLTLASCSDNDEAAKTALPTPTITEGDKTVSTLRFNWQAIEGATQYGYELKDQAGETVTGGTTTATTLLATGLQPNSPYTLTVWAYAALTGNKTTSAIASLTATTNDVVKLAAPSVSWQQTSGGIELSWQPVSGAAFYELSWTDAEGEAVADSTEANTYTIAGLPVGSHLIGVRACSDNENYTHSDTTRIEVVRSKQTLWTTGANYYSEAIQQNFSCQVACFEDGSYEVQGIYGSEAKLEFTVDEEHQVDGIPEVVFTNAYKAAAPYYYFRAGNYTLCIYYMQGTGYTGWENGSKDKGELWFYVYLYDADGNYLGAGFDDITWGSETTE